MLIPYKQLIDKYNICPTGVIHVGANTGQEVSDYYSNGVKRTIWVEADPGLISELTNNLNNYPEHVIINSCLTDKDDDEIVLNIANNGGQSSSILELDYHAIVHPEVHFINKVSVTTSRLDTLFTKYNLKIKEYPFLNIDVQGAELLVLKGMGNLLNDIQYVYIEVNDAELYKGNPLYTDIKDYLAQFGFTPKEKVMAGNFKWGDAVFMR